MQEVQKSFIIPRGLILRKERKMPQITEIERIRKKFCASRKQFGRVFVGKSETMIKYYEKGITPTPESVIKLARLWEQFLDSMNAQKE